MFRVELSARAWIREEVELRSSWKSVGERTEPWGTQLRTGKGTEVSSSTTTDTKQSV